MILTLGENGIAFSDDAIHSHFHNFIHQRNVQLWWLSGNCGWQHSRWFLNIFIRVYNAFFILWYVNSLQISMCDIQLYVVRLEERRALQGNCIILVILLTLLTNICCFFRNELRSVDNYGWNEVESWLEFRMAGECNEENTALTKVKKYFWKDVWASTLEPCSQSEQGSRVVAKMRFCFGLNKAPCENRNVFLKRCYFFGWSCVLSVVDISEEQNKKVNLNLSEFGTNLSFPF